MAFRAVPMAEASKARRLLCAVTKKDLVKQLAKRTFLPEDTAATQVDQVLALLGDALVRGETVTLKGFGRFTTRKHKARSIAAFSGERIALPARVLPHFKPSPTLVKQLRTRMPSPPPPTDPNQPDLFGASA